MRRVLLAAGAVLLLSGPTFADEVTIEKKTITREEPDSGSTLSTVVVAPNPPPPPRAEVAPPAPGPDLTWVPGHWTWNTQGRDFVWLQGRYVEPPRAHAAWVPGHWVQRESGWVWEDGHWD